MQVRAYGLLLTDISERTKASGAAEEQALEGMKKLVGSCVRGLPACRPTFSEALAMLQQMAQPLKQ